VPTRKPRATARKQPTQSRSRETVEVILIAAERVLARDGVTGLTTPRIAEVAGISVGSLYQYFPNKEAICGALIERTLEQYHRLLQAALDATHPLPVDAAFKSVIDGMLTVYLHNAKLHAGLMEMVPLAGRQELYRRWLARHTAAVTRDFEARGAEVRQPADLTAYMLMCTADGVMQALTHDGLSEERARQLIREVTDLAVAYLRPLR
jgi:AcrR family transcriptional regulator